MKKYETLGIAGDGAYGVVFKCKNKETKELVAMKKFKDFDPETQEFVRKNTLRELKMLKTLKHKNIVKLIEAFKKNNKLFLIFEHIDYSLLEFIEKKENGVKENLIKSIIFQSLEALNFMHKLNIIHRDIKPENILIDR